MTEGIQELKQLISFPKEVVIISHRNPDGDAVGSACGLALYLQKLHHNVKVIFPSEYTSKYNFIQGIRNSIVFDLDPNGARQAVDKAELIFCVDLNALDRIDKLGENVQFSKAKKVMIDHHLDPEPFVDVIISEVDASSTCELIFKVIDELGDRSKIDPIIGECLFTGIVSDTGSFKYATRSYTYEVAAILKEIGVDDYQLADRLFNQQKEKHLRLLGFCLANRLEVIKEYGVGIMWLSKADYMKFDIQRGDTEGIVNYILMIENVKVAALVLEQPTIVKISLRSKGDISVQDMVSKHFNGGGHKNAAGGSAYASLKDVLSKFRKILPEYLPKIDI